MVTLLVAICMFYRGGVRMSRCYPEHVWVKLRHAETSTSRYYPVVTYRIAVQPCVKEGCFYAGIPSDISIGYSFFTGPTLIPGSGELREGAETLFP